LTLTPMMCGQILRSAAERPPGLLARAAEWPMTVMTRFYMRTLSFALARRRFMLALTFGTLALTGYLYVIIPKGFLPRQDTGLLTIVLQGAPDVSFLEMSRLQSAVSSIISKDKDVAGVVSVIGVGTLNATPNVSHLAVTLTSRDGRSDTADAIGERLAKEASEVAGVTLFVEPVQDIQITTRASRSQYQYTLTGTDADEIGKWAAQLADHLRSDGTFRNIALETQDGGLRTFIDIDREMTGRLGLSVQNIDDTLNDAFGQRQISTIYARQPRNISPIRRCSRSFMSRARPTQRSRPRSAHHRRRRSPPPSMAGRRCRLRPSPRCGARPRPCRSPMKSSSRRRRSPSTLRLTPPSATPSTRSAGSSARSSCRFPSPAPSARTPPNSTARSRASPGSSSRR
jgi:multidrug efflux pump subunit AcrB